MTPIPANTPQQRKQKLRSAVHYWTCVEHLERRTLMAGIAFATPITSDIATLDFPVVNTVSGDLNGDGVPDLVAARDNLEAQVYLGSTTGVLSPSVIVATGGTAIALGDFNNDTHLDLATANGILPGVGDGTFGTVINSYTLPANTVNLYAEDVNGDGNLDLVAATLTPAGGTGTTATNPTVGLTVLLGNGNGTFGSPISTTVGSGANINASYATFAFGAFDANTGDIDALTPFGLMMGDGDGTFSTPVVIPFKTTGSTLPVVPSAPLLAVGDFNGDGALDFATVPTAAGTGQIEIFLGNGAGGFTDNGPITVGAGDTITSLTASDLLASGQSDLIAGVLTLTNTSNLEVFNNSGSATFDAPLVYATPGAPLTVTPEDFNGDGTLDLLSVNEAAGSLAGDQAATASVLLGTENSGVVPTVNLRASVNPVIAGSPVEFFANIFPPSGSTLGTPTGNVTFLNGATTLGTAALVNGKANLTTTAAGVGTQLITVQYTGDTNYAAANSNPLSLAVLVSGAKQPLLVPELGAVTLPAEFLPGDSGTATVLVTNGGDATGSGKISINLYLSADGAIDASAIPLTVPSFQNRSIHLTRGHAVAVKARLVADALPAGTYSLLAQLVPVTGYTADEISGALIVSPITLQAAGMVFGDLGAHHGLKLKLPDASNNVASFSISGPGLGTVTQVNGVNQIAVTGVTTASKVNITGKGAYTIGDMTIDNSLNGVSAHTATLGGSLTVAGAVKTLTLAGVAAPDGSAVPIILGAETGVTPTLSLGNVATATLTSTGALKTVLATAWQAGAIDAPSIGALTVKGAFGADVRTHANGILTAAKIGSITGGTWSIAGAINSLRVLGDVSNATIFAGADTGPDDLLGTIDDVFNAAIIGTLFIGGADTTTLIVAGASFPPGANPIFGNLTLLPGGAIHSIVVKGAASPDSHFLSAKLPHTATLDGVKTTTATDPRFAA